MLKSVLNRFYRAVNLMAVGLILEGGGMRGAYTAGVLQALYSEKLNFDYITGVSAGALTAVSYISGQPRRNYDTFVQYASDPRYMGLNQLHQTGNIFNFNFVLGTLCEELLPLDKEAFFASDARFMIGTTDLNTGKAVFYDKESLRGDDKYSVLRASASLPLLADTIHWKGHPLLDGGIADPIPIDRSIADGNDKHVVVLTRDRSFVCKKYKNMALIERRYAAYPDFIEAIKRRHVVYQQQREQIFELEKQGKAVVIAPREPITITRYERRSEPLAALHDRGMIDTAYKLDEIRRLMNA